MRGKTGAPDELRQRLGRLLVCIAMAYVGFAGVAAGILVQRGASMTAAVSTPSNSAAEPPETARPEVRAILTGKVRNVFGDPVPGAELRISAKALTTGPDGAYRLEEAPLGPHEIVVEAPGYATLKVWVDIQPGLNEADLKYDSGLKPERFATDFHVFVNKPISGPERLYATIAFANPEDQDYLVEDMVVYDPMGQPVYDLTGDFEELTRLATALGELPVVSQPQPGMVIPAGGVYSNDLPPAPHPIPNGRYVLMVKYRPAFRSGKVRVHVLSVVDVADVDEDWNPHLP